MRNLNLELNVYLIFLFYNLKNKYPKLNWILFWKIYLIFDLANSRCDICWENTQIIETPKVWFLRLDLKKIYPRDAKFPTCA